MAGMMDFIQQQITPETIAQISNEIGEDPEKTRQAIDASIPMLAGAISAQAADVAPPTGDALTQPAMFGGLGDMISGGAAAGGVQPGAQGGGLGGALGGLGGLGGVLGGMLGGGAGSGAGGAGGMLDSILGGAGGSVQNDVAKASGMDPQKVMRMLMMLAPIVLSAYARHKQSGGTAPQPSTPTQGGGGGILGDIIDRVT
ncbi:MAG: DUF937 domain-containing protein [Gemmatimonadota bacterium]|nr:DUF937 domain-containing protein [Gemmatimonadota bacterium]